MAQLPGIPEGALVTVHRAMGSTYDGRITYHQEGGTFVVDLRRTSLADNGYRKVREGDVVHLARAQFCHTPCMLATT